MKPRTAAIISTIAAVILGVRILISSSGISPMLTFVQWTLFILALVGAIGSFAAMRKK